MKPFVFLILCINIFLSSHVFCSWNPVNFNELKKELCNSQRVPFYVVVISRTGQEPINRVDITFLQMILKRLFSKEYTFSENELIPNIKTVSMLENSDEKYYLDNPLNFYLHSDWLLSRALKKLEKTSDPSVFQKFIAEKKYKEKFTDIDTSLEEFSLNKMPGFVVFNEYFFYGGVPGNYSIIEKNLAKKVSNDFSTIASSMIWICNFLTLKSYEEMPSIQSKFIKYIKKERCFSSLPTTSSQDLRYQLSNQTFFSHKGKIHAVYNKSTYVTENDIFLKGERTSYKFGEWYLKPKTTLGYTLAANVWPQICADYACSKKPINKNANFQILQSNSIETAWSFLQKCTKMRSAGQEDFPNQMEPLQKGKDHSRFLIYSDPFTVLKNPAFFEKNAEEDVSHPKECIKGIQYEINGIMYYISVYEIKE